MQQYAFSPSELTPVGFLPGMPGAPASQVFGSPISPLENFRRLIRGDTPLWLHSMADCVMISPSVVPDNVARGMVIENRPFDMAEAGGPDMFGVRWEYVPQVMGSMVRPGHPMLEDANDWEKTLVFPDVDSWDWAGSAAINRDFRVKGFPLLTSVMTGLFERLVSFMEMSGALVALIDEDQTDAIHALFERLCDLYDELFAHLRQYLGVDIINFHDDWGSQRAPFFSLNTCRTMLVPYLRRVVESAHKYGMVLDFHSCGKNELLVPAMIEAGVDSWWGQPMNDKKKLYSLYGDQLTLGVDLEVTPDATPEQTAAAVDALLADYPRGNVFLGMFRGPACARELLYEKSRKAFCG